MNIKSLHILLADDDTDDCLFFKVALEAMPVFTQFKTVHDGEQLMQLLSRETEQLPHVLFLDLNMPRKNGFECLAEIKQDEKLKMLPVVIFSTSYEQEVVNLLYNGRAQYFIRKPSEFALFKKIIFHVLTLITQDLLTGHVKNINQPTRENFVLTAEDMLTI